jgi:hypothetical protein
VNLLISGSFLKLAHGINLRNEFILFRMVNSDSQTQKSASLNNITVPLASRRGIRPSLKNVSNLSTATLALPNLLNSSLRCYTQREAQRIGNHEKLTAGNAHCCNSIPINDKSNYSENSKKNFFENSSQDGKSYLSLQPSSDQRNLKDDFRNLSISECIEILCTDNLNEAVMI